MTIEKTVVDRQDTEDEGADPLNLNDPVKRSRPIKLRSPRTRRRKQHKQAGFRFSE